MADWYYTTNKQQMGPVSLEELQQLASTGILKPTDLVWRDGMRDWARASTQDWFDMEGAPTAKPSRWDTEEDDRPRRRRRPVDEDEDELDEDRPRRRRRFRDEGMPVGLKVGLILGGVVVLLVVVGVVIFLVAGGGGGGGVPAGPIGMGTFNGFLAWGDPRDPKMRNPSKTYNLTLQAGKTYHIELRSKAFDAFLRLENGMGMEVAANDDGARGQPFAGPLDSLIIYTPPNTDNFRIIVTSLDGRTGGYTLIVREGLNIGVKK